MTALRGLDPYGGGARLVGVGTEGAHVELSVEGSEGNGHALLTPDQAKAVASWLISEANIAAIIEGDDQP